MEKRFQMTAEGLVISALVVLTPTEQEKLECKDLEKAINHIANNLHIKWAVEISGNIATATISKQFGPVVGDNHAHEVEMAANNFMRAIEHLYLPREEKKTRPEENTPIEDSSDVVITFTVGSNAARVIKALRECTNVTLEVAKRYAKNGRLVCSYNEAEGIMENLEVSGATDVHIDEKLTDDLNFCNDILANWDETDEMAQTTGALILCGVHGGNLQGVCGHIPEDLLKKMFIAYVESI